MKPYYQEGGITIYHADCRQILWAVPVADLVLTDPPYGIASVWTHGGRRHGWQKANDEMHARNEWDGEPPDAATMKAVLEIGKDAIVWGGNYFALPPSRGWLVWNKPERGFSLSEAELAWTTLDMVIRVKDLPRSEYDRIHPTQKPLKLMTWCLGFFPQARTVVDPFMGSGTSLVAAKQMGLEARGIERDERWCEIAAKRLAQGVMDFGKAEPERNRG